MKPINTNFTPLNEIDKNLTNQGSTSSIHELRNNIKSFTNLTNSTNFSNENNKRNKINLRKNESTKVGLKKPIISISTPGRENSKRKESPIKLASLVPTNVNSFQHLITEPFGIFENINWTLGLRGPHRKNVEISKEKMSIKGNFNEPYFYMEDLKKYKNKQRKIYDAKIEKLNPNYNKIKHLVLGNRTGNINYSQFNFSTCLRDYNSKDSNNIVKEKKWKYTPLPKLKSDKYIVKCLSPITPAGIQNFKKLENIMPKNYEVIHGEAIVGNDKIKTKKLVNNRSYTVSGYGECLGDKKYNNKFGDNNMFANKRILRVASNPLSKFELGLRIYGSLTNIKKYKKINTTK